jgi:endonuclease/exonuclease/phosphatase family metal-dependent hydrolase
MTVRFASFNVENLFARPKAFNQTTWAEGQPIVDAFHEFNELIAQVDYSAADKARMVELLLLVDVYRTDNGVVRRYRTPSPKWAWLRANRGTFDVEHKTTGVEIIANHRVDWTGWLELATEPVDELATRMTAQVISLVGAHVQAVIEAEDRPALARFNDELLAGRFAHVMLIDGNDTRGIDVGVMTTSDVEITDMRSNVDTPDPAKESERLFSRDCAEYRCQLPSGEVAWVLVNHFKSQSGGGDAKRARQAEGVRTVVDGLINAGQANIIVVGDFNEGPPRFGELPKNLMPLFVADSPLVDAYSLESFDVGPRPGTFQSCSIRNRLDYILVSRNLAPKVVNGGVERHGLWGTPTNKNKPTDWEIFPDITASEQAASDHGAIFVDIDI